MNDCCCCVYCKCYSMTHLINIILLLLYVYVSVSFFVNIHFEITDVCYYFLLVWFYIFDFGLQIISDW